MNFGTRLRRAFQIYVNLAVIPFLAEVTRPNTTDKLKMPTLYMKVVQNFIAVILIPRWPSSVKRRPRFNQI